MARRREFDVFSWSFLDCITCGFGAVVLMFVIINSQVTQRADQASNERRSETNKLEEQVLDARKDLVRLKNSRRTRQTEEATAEGDARRVEELLKKLREDLVRNENDSLARKASVEQLKADIKQLEETNLRLSERAGEPEPASGQRIRSFVGEGNRQYVTGLKVGGKHVLFLVDTSTSMLGRTYVDVLRFRSMQDARKRATPKWQQVVKTVDWLTTQVTPGTQFQMYLFNEQAHSAVEGTDGKWIDVQDGTELTRALNNLKKVIPAKGTSLINAFRAIDALQPRPDNIYLLTDGFPTIGESPPPQPESVDGGRRRALFRKALSALPGRVPVNVVLFPMDGDPGAALDFWELAVSTGGALMSPSRDWP